MRVPSVNPEGTPGTDRIGEQACAELVADFLRDSGATTDVLRLFDQLHANGQTLVVVTHDERIAATADRLISMRDGAFVDETKLTGGSARPLVALTGLEG